MINPEGQSAKYNVNLINQQFEGLKSARDNTNFFGKNLISYVT
jgi:hypothetical protein